MSIWRKQGGIIGKPDGGNVYPSSGSWDVTESYTDENVSPAGEVLFSTVQSSYNWTVPGDTVGTVSILCVGGGGGGGRRRASDGTGRPAHGRARPPAPGARPSGPYACTHVRTYVVCTYVRACVRAYVRAYVST